MELVIQDVTVKIGERTILKNVSGTTSPGSMMAIMGPSGSGKTTLLNVAAGRCSPDTGVVTLDTQPVTRKLKRKICYVLQEDVFFPNLTLLETLTFTALLRLPENMKYEDKLVRMYSIIDALDIRYCLDTIIGNLMRRGLSGGEKKRANIACELMTDPNMILLDEPTSGLDYSTALSLVKTLKSYTAEHNKTVVTTIHQPSSQIFHQCDKLLLLCEGEVAFYGDTAGVIPFFEHMSLPMTPHYNPADFILEKLKESKEIQEKILKASYELRKSSIWPEVLKNPVINDCKNSDSVTRKEHKYKVQIKGKETTKGEDDVHASLVNVANAADNYDQEDKWPSSFLTQYKQLVIRTFKQSKTRILDPYKIAESLILAGLVGLIWFQLPRTEDTLRDRMGVIFFLVIHYGFSPMFDAVQSFPMEFVVINKERSAGWYRLSAYYLAKLSSELPLVLLPPLLFTTIVYWAVGLNGIVAFVGTIGIAILNSIVGQSIGLFIGIICMDMRRAVMMSTVTMMTSMLLGGLYTRHLPFWFDWSKYLDFIYYSFHALMILEFTNAAPVQCASQNISQFSSCVNGTDSWISSGDVLQMLEIDWPLYVCILALLAFSVVLRIAGYLVLRYVRCP